ncbi:MAG TPA: hypothetical protein VKT81_04015 [Bryobacteraceae bacterium]|nr:hypothetical protein [Bryobacteraceae bacterium]
MPPSASRLPALPRSVLAEVEDCERFAVKSLVECKGEGEYPLSYNFTKAQRVVKTCAVEAFDIQARHYLDQEGCCEHWIELIEFYTRQAMNSLALTNGFPDQYKEMLDSELRQEALKGKVEEWKEKVRALLERSLLARSRAVSAHLEATMEHAREVLAELEAPIQATQEISNKPTEIQPATTDERARRAALLADYKLATKHPSNRKIYTARNSGIHKPEFYDWINAILPKTSQTCVNFERFLEEKKPPVARTPKP